MSKQFSAVIWDYLVFAVFLICSTIYPIWSDVAGRKGQSTKANYVFATGRVAMLPMMLSIARGTLGVRAFLGFPSELFYRGAGMWETLYGIVNAYPIVCFVFIPVYCNLEITSVYQYLDLRFKSKFVRRLASFSFIIRNCLNMGITIYTPSVALNIIAGIPYWASLSAMTLLSIVFTISGGLKAAITADAIQGTTLLLVCILVIIQGTYETGGAKEVFKINRDNDRLQFFKLSGDITTRVDTLSAWMGQLFVSIGILGCQQNLVQRYLSISSQKEIRKTLLANIPCISILFSLAWICGMAIYSTYYRCDPMAAGYTEKFDSILPFFVSDKLSYIPGFMGLFLATLFNGALCISVSNINSVATVTWEDFLSTRYKNVKDKQQLNAIKYLAFIYAVIILGIAYCVGFLSGIIESAMLTGSATTGPLVGAFLLAMLVPMANSKGVIAGMIASHACTLILICGSYTIARHPDVVLPTSTEGCTNTTFSPWIDKLDSSWILQHSLVEIDWTQNYTSANHTHNAVLPHVEHERTLVDSLFGMTYMYYAVIGTFVTIIVAIVVSYFTASDEDAYDENLLHPCVIKLRHWYNGTSPAARPENIETSPVPNVNEAYEITEDGEASASGWVQSNVDGVVDASTINPVEMGKCKTQVPLERFKKLNDS